MTTHRTLARTLVVLLAFLAIPSLVHYLLPVSSMAPGLIVVCVGVLALCPWKLRSSTIPLDSNISLLLAAALFVAVHFVIAALLVPVDGWRFAGSFVGLGLVLTAAAVAAPVLFGGSGDDRRPERFAFLALLVVAVFGAIGLAPPGADEYFKPVFPFTEPSLFGLSFLPLLAFMCVTSSRGKRYLFLTIGLAVALLLQNLTLLVGLLMIALISAPIAGGVLLSVAVAAAIAFVDVDVSYYLSRLEFTETASNLSSLVYLQGWQLAADSLWSTAGWGIGFQQLGAVASAATDASDVIYDLVGGNPNLRDGGFVLSKLVSEFGVFAVVALALHLRFALRCAGRLRRIARGESRAPAGTVFALCVVVMYLIEVYVRSAGYFVGTGALFLAALLHLRGAERAERAAARRARSALPYAAGSPTLASLRANS